VTNSEQPEEPHKEFNLANSIGSRTSRLQTEHGIFKIHLITATPYDIVHCTPGINTLFHDLATSDLRVPEKIMSNPPTTPLTIKKNKKLLKIIVTVPSVKPTCIKAPINRIG
jgi:hypothetical protein